MKVNYLTIIVAIYLFFFQSFSFGQDSSLSKADSLKNKIEQLPDEKAKVDALIDLSKVMMSSSLEETINYGEQAFELAEQLDDKPGMALALKNIGLGYYYQSDYLNVFEYWERSLEMYKEINDQAGVANLESNLGSIYFNQGDDATAVEYSLRSLAAAETINDSLGMARALNLLGAVYMNKSVTLDRAKEYFLRAMDIFENLDYKNGIAACAVNLGDIYHQQKQYVSSLYYLQTSIDYFENQVFVPHSYNLMGEVYRDMGKYKEAMEYLEKAIDLANDQNIQDEACQALISLGKTHQLQGNYSEASIYFKEAKNIAEDIGANNELKDAYDGLAKLSAEIGDFNQAFSYFQLYDAMKDTLYNLETDEKIKNLQFTYQLDKKETEIELQEAEIKQQKIFTYSAVFTGFMFILLAGGLFNRYRYIRKTKKIIENEKDRSDNLLLNILPAETAEELKEKGSAKARSYNNVTILFTDFKGFTQLSATLSPPALVKEIHHCYMAFDEIMARYGVEKIKTIGDAYMAAGGLPKPNDSHPIDVTLAAMEIRAFMDKLKKDRIKQGKPYFEIRIGIHSGPVVAGVVGTHKFAYDIWGDTVNIASRMESNSEPGKINVSEATYELIKEQFECTPRGKIAVKGAGEKTMYFVEKPNSEDLLKVKQASYA
jgi:adenylate cyclase